MKKWCFFVATMCAVFCLSAPAFAVDAKLSGEYRVRGLYLESTNMDPEESPNSYMDMRLRLKPVFTITDDIKLVTRFDALDNKMWGDADTTVRDADNPENFDWDYTYMVLKTKIGAFLVGRQPDGPWGTVFADTVDPADRITYVLPIEDFRFAAIFEKWYEFDGIDSTESSNDNDKYYLTGSYKTDNLDTGLLLGYYDVKNFVDLGTSDPTVTAILGQAGLSGRPINARVFIAAPFFEGDFGPFGLTTELVYVFGTAEYTASSIPALAGALGPMAALLEDEDHDVKAYAFNLEGRYTWGPLRFEMGWATYSGDILGGDDDDTIEGFGYIEEGGDWEKMFILNNTTHGLDTGLGGGMGNLAGGRASVTCVAGYQMYYAGIDYSPMEDLTFGVKVATSKADQVRDSWDDDHGQEYDFIFTWDINDNLEYKMIAAYLDAGDFWKQGNPDLEIENPWTFFHALTLSF